jgi:ubiquinone/menaquinone biosynthesis C-methylase UbiE
MLRITGGNALIDANLITIKADLTEGMKVADLGCGTTGHFVFPTARIVGKSGIVYAVDILKTALENVKKMVKQENAENVKTVWSDLEVYGATGIEPNSLDLVMLNNTLYLSSKRKNIISEAIRLLKKGGRLMIVEWKLVALPFGPSIENRVREDLIKNTAQKMGLELKEEFEAGPYHYGLIFEKH